MRRAGLAGVAALLGLCTTTFASGFEIDTAGVRAIALINAGRSALAEDATTVWFNPAGMIRLDGWTVTNGLALILGRTEFNDGGSTTGGAPLLGGGSGNASDPELVGHFYVAKRLSDMLAAGIGLNAPFGLGNDYGGSWAGRYHADDARLLTLTLNPSFAARISDHVTLGGGFSVQYAHANISNKIDFGSIGAANGLPLTPQMHDGRLRLTGDDLGFGWNIGLLAEIDENTRIGLAFRSYIHHEIDGDADFRVPPEAAALTLGGLFTDTGARAGLSTPETLSLSAYRRIRGGRWAVVTDVKWSGWSRFKELRVRFDNPVQPDGVNPGSWDDTWAFSLGVIYEHDEKWTFRSGAGFVENPIPLVMRNPRIPDNDRLEIGFGFSYRWSERTTIDVSYNYTYFKRAGSFLNGEADAAGTLIGDYEVDAHTIAVGATMKF